jgi:hypothetical protein
MLRWVVVLCCFAGSVSAEEVPPSVPVRLTPKQVEAVKAGVRDGLKDPESARFGQMLAARHAVDGSVMVCGHVNAKNSYGGYTGSGYFIGIFPIGGGRFALNRVATDREDYAEARRICGIVGLALD